MRPRRDNVKGPRKVAVAAAATPPQLIPDVAGVPVLVSAASAKDDQLKLEQMLRRLIDLNHEMDVAAVLEDETPE